MRLPVTMKPAAGGTLDSLLGRFGIAGQTAAIGAAGVLGVLFIGLLHYVGSEKLPEINREAEIQSSILAKAYEIKVDLLEARRSEKDFLLKRNEAALQKHASALARFNEDVKALAALENFAARAGIDKLSETIDEYRKQFQTVSGILRKEGFDENSGLQGALRASVHDIEHTIEGLKSASLEAAMLFMRRHEKDFIARLDTKYAAKWNEAAGNFRTQLGQSWATPDAKAQIEEKLAAYRRDFNALVTGTMERVEAVNRLSSLYAEAEPLLEKLEAGEQKSVQEAKQKMAASAQTSTRAINWSIGLAGLGVAVLAWLIGRNLVRPLLRLKGSIMELATGNCDIVVAGTSRRDEIGKMASALQGLVEKLRSVASEFQSAGEYVSSGSQELSASSGQLASGAIEQASAAEQASSAMDQMAVSIKHNASSASQTEKIARQSAADAEMTGQSVNRAMQAMQSIAGKINVVQEIARQTDLLALNAAVEAARAGQHGKGFAVVATEVRKLAERSQMAAQEIGALSGQTVTVAGQAGEMLSKLVPDIKKTAGLVEEISAVCREQDASAAQINGAIRQLDKVIQQNAAAAEQMSATARDLAERAERLHSSISFFRIGRRAQSGPADALQPVSRAPAAGRNYTGRGIAIKRAKTAVDGDGPAPAPRSLSVPAVRTSSTPASIRSDAR